MGVLDVRQAVRVDADHVRVRRLRARQQHCVSTQGDPARVKKCPSIAQGALDVLWAVYIDAVRVRISRLRAQQECHASKDGLMRVSATDRAFVL